MAFGPGPAPPSSPMGGMGSLLAAAGGGAPGAEQADAATQATALKIRDIGQQLQMLAAENPLVVEDVQQINQLLKGILVKTAQAAMTQTASGMAVPTGGM